MKPINSIIVEGKVWKADIATYLLAGSHKNLIEFPLCYESNRIQSNGTVVKEFFEVTCQYTGKLPDGFFSCTQYTIIRVVGRLTKNLFELSKDYGNLCIIAEHLDKKATA